MPDSNLPLPPQNFDHVERYVSSLPLERARDIRLFAETVLELYQNGNSIINILTSQKKPPLTEDEKTIVTLAGFIMELTN